MPQTFSGQRPDEQFILLFRRHILTARRGLFALLIMLVLGFIPFFIWPTNPIIFRILAIAALIGVLLLLYHYILWHFSFYIVTNERIRQVSQKGLFKKSVIDLSLDKVLSVSHSVPGFFGTLFGYGTIVIQTAAGDLIISQAARPESVHDKLQNAVDLASRKMSSHDKETNP